METIKNYKIQIIVMVLLLIGLAVGVFLVQKQQIFKSRASSGINAALTVTDLNGKDLEYQGSGVYNTNSLDVQIGIKDLEQLK